MKKIFLVVLGFLIIGISAYLVNAEIAKQEQPLFSKYEDIIPSKKDAIIYFYSENCSYCINFYPTIKLMSEEFAEKFLFVKIDVNDSEYSHLVRKFRLRSIPALFIFDQKKRDFRQISPYYFSVQNLRRILTEY